MLKLSIDQTLLLAQSHANKGEIEQAKVLYQSVLEAFPKNQHARQALDHLNTAKPAQGAGEHPPKGEMDALIALFHQGNFRQASEKAEQLAQDFPMSFVVWNISGIINKMLGLINKSEECFRKAIYINVEYSEAHTNLGNVLKDKGKLKQAIASYRRALEIKPDYANAHYNMGIALEGQGQLDDAIACYQFALKIKPNYVEALNNLGNALCDQGKLDEAIAAFGRALYFKPDYAQAYNNMGNALRDQGKLDDAIVAIGRALNIQPDNADAHINMGNALKDLGKLDEAITAFGRSLNIQPDNAVAHNNMGNALRDQGKLNEAITSCQKALKIEPDYADAYINMGNALKDLGKLDEAIASYQKALKIKPDYAFAQSQMLYQLQHVCDFERTAALYDVSATLGIETAAVPPFAALSWVDSSEQQLARSWNWARERYKQALWPILELQKSRPARLKVGYFSADFHDHATMYLIAGLLRDHDHAKFELFAYSYGHNKSGDWRKGAERDVDYFFEVTDLSDRAIVDLASSHSLDVAVDLKGYTAHSRSGIFKCRLAPIQINYLGYPGSLGAAFIDYVIADPVVIPLEQRQFYSEKVIYLPHSYQPNDDAREIAQTTTTRADFGLPEEGFVFCCFNNTYKISTREFDIWMRLLSKVEGSVLWLFKANKWAEQNLRKEAEKRGINPLRLVFAERASHAEHLARHKHADVFIDTFNVNAHTTASDSLWAGLPIVTKQGKQFAARVAASLLTAVGIPELITQNEADYEALILELATNRDKLAAIREKLALNRLTQPLFDTKRYTRDFEAGLTAACDLYYTDQVPQDIWV